MEPDDKQVRAAMGVKVRSAKGLVVSLLTASGSAARGISPSATRRETTVEAGGTVPIVASSRQTVAADALVALVSAILEVTSAVVVAGNRDEPAMTAAAGALLVATTVPLVWRRRSPLAVLAAAGLLHAAYGIAPYPDPFLPLAPLVALYTVVERERPPLAAVGAAVTVMVVILSNVFAQDASPSDYYQNLLVAAIACLLGGLMRYRRRLLEAAIERADRVERERAAETARAAAAERARIARELHDVVAHHVSMLVVQAESGAATTPAAAPAFDVIAGTGRSALTELRRLLGVLRDDGVASAPAEKAPQPGLASLQGLVASVRAAGLAVDLTIDGGPRPLPAGVELSAYRIVQEALTNALRHANGSWAGVVVRYRSDALELAVRDDGRSVEYGALASGGHGHGLVGMRERVAMLGGTFSAGGAEGGGFEVLARLPVTP